jgi:hypothetical protein
VVDSLSSGSGGPRGGHVDTTNTVSVGLSVGNLDVATLTPAGAPGVTDDPVLEVVSVTDSIANDCDGVVG